MTDPLKDAVQALRTSTSGKESGAGHYTRARVLSTIRQKKRRRVLNVAFGIPLAAILVGSGAWASQGALPHWVERISVSLGLRSAPTAPSALVLPTLRSRVHSSASGEHPGPRPEVPRRAEDSSPPPAASNGSATSIIPEPERSPRVDTRRQTHSANPVDSRATELELSLYEKAHRAHFVQRDPGAALVAWNEYLRSAPRGRFAIEAQYNRAVCLVRLGRHVEARAALTPYAKGTHGGYRQAEARALIEELERVP